MIKFRAWDKASKTMRCWKDIDLSKDIGDDYWLIGYKKSKTVIAYDHDQVLMQYTGLIDVNGVEIYEGDIAKLYWSDEIGEPHTTQVVMKNPFEYREDETRYYIFADGIEVVGNIYENPELSEVTE